MTHRMEWRQIVKLHSTPTGIEPMVFYNDDDDLLLWVSGIIHCWLPQGSSDDSVLRHMAAYIYLKLQCICASCQLIVVNKGTPRSHHYSCTRYSRHSHLSVDMHIMCV